jgi:1,4-alpha-glucan branching enzyme
LRRFNEEIYKNYPDVQTIAEESTSWPMVSRPLYVGGLGFGLKWDMGWMHDTLNYMQRDPVYRRYHHNQLTFRSVYAFSENFVLSLSHDEVVHGKGSLLNKLPGDYWQRCANLRALFGYMYAQSGKKLLFMGCEFGQWREWNHDTSLDWHLVEEGPFCEYHRGIQRWVSDLNHFYASEPALYEYDCDAAGFEWIDGNDSEQSVYTFLRRGQTTYTIVVVACNFTPLVRERYRIGVPRGGWWREALNSDSEYYAGSGTGNAGGVLALDTSCHGRSHMLEVTLPPLGIVFFVSEIDAKPELPEPTLSAEETDTPLPVPQPTPPPTPTPEPTPATVRDTASTTTTPTPEPATASDTTSTPPAPTSVSTIAKPPGERLPADGQQSDSSTQRDGGSSGKGGKA